MLRALDGALTDLALGPEQATIVTDIGCVGMADSLFPTTHTVHSLHGRSVAIASGLQLGRRVVADAGPLKPVVLIGDGGATIGLLHLVHAAQLNVDVTVLVHNNLIYGMTGGQHSGLTPLGLRTTTTPQGSPVPPMDVLAILGGAGAGFLARVVAPGEELQPTIAAAITHPGFACVEVLELCPSFATKRGGVTGKSLKQLPAERVWPPGSSARRSARRRSRWSPPSSGSTSTATPTPGPTRACPAWTGPRGSCWRGAPASGSSRRRSSPPGPRPRLGST